MGCSTEAANRITIRACECAKGVCTLCRVVLLDCIDIISFYWVYYIAIFGIFVECE